MLWLASTSCMTGGSFTSVYYKEQQLKSAVCESLVNDGRVEPNWQRQFGDKERINNECICKQSA